MRSSAVSSMAAGSTAAWQDPELGVSPAEAQPVAEAKP